MASAAIDVVDLNWRILQQCGEKLRSLRGSRLVDRCNPSRARGDRCKRRIKNGEARIIALERASRRRDEIGQQVEEMAIDDEDASWLEAWPTIENRDLVTAEEIHAYLIECQRHEVETHLAQRGEEEEEEIFLEAIAHGFRERARAIRLIECPSYFEDQVSALEIDPEIGDLTTAHLIEDFEREALQGFAA